MKLLFVGTDRDWAGCAMHFVALAKAMAGAGHEVGALVDTSSTIGTALARTNVSIHHGRFRNAFDPCAHVNLWQTIRRECPDWIVGNFGKEYWPLVVQGRLCGRPVALFRHRMLPMKYLSTHFLPRLAQRFIAVSQHARRLFIEQGMAADRVQVLYNPLDADYYQPDRESGLRMRHSLGISGEAVVVGFAGRMYESKGIFCLLNALTGVMRKRGDVHVLWLGDGPDLEHLAEAIQGTGLAAWHHVCGRQGDVRDYYRAMSMLALPSLTGEAFGRVSIEAQASGVPVLGSRIGGIPETMVDGLTGCLLEPGNVSVWRDAILALCNPTKTSIMGVAARDVVVRRFSYPVIAAKFCALLQGTEKQSHS